MDIKLYYTPQTRSIRPRWLLEELGIEYKLQHIDLFAGEGESPEYKQINPLGAVPALEVDGEVMLESGAMCHWLTDYYSDSGLAPSIEEADRRSYEQWMIFSQATLEMSPWLIILHSKLLPESRRVDAIVPWAEQQYQSVLKVLNAALGEDEYLVGNGFTTADIMVGSTLMFMPDKLAEFPALTAYIERLMKRPGFLRASKD
ncbi:MAG TPA: glutathione S-transferase family protein [Gammaproteobacteria bacterium]|nr:glutathione S-transferase family protein [Gammaproteobacteria bacterium]